MKYAWILFVLFALTASAADVGGTWKGSIETPNGAMENTFVFKADGEKLTGTVSMGQFGDAEISEGKVDGETLTFAVVRNFNGNEFKLAYKGKVKDNQITLTVTVPGREMTFEMTLRTRRRNRARKENVGETGDTGFARVFLGGVKRIRTCVREPGPKSRRVPGRDRLGDRRGGCW